MAGQSVRLKIAGMTCQGCADTISRYLRREKGVEKADIQWLAGSGEVIFDPAVTSEEKILQSQAFEGHYSAEVAH